MVIRAERRDVVVRELETAVGWESGISTPTLVNEVYGEDTPHNRKLLISVVARAKTVFQGRGQIIGCIRPSLKMARANEVPYEHRYFIVGEADEGHAVLDTTIRYVQTMAQKYRNGRSSVDTILKEDQRHGLALLARECISALLLLPPDAAPKRLKVP